MRTALALASCVLLGACVRSSIVLLPDESGGQGSVAVLESAGVQTEAVIAEGNSRTTLGKKAPISKPLGKKGLRQKQTALLSSLPPPARSFSLYFRQGTVELYTESMRELDTLRAEIARRSGAEVEVTGHTDTVGSEEDNDALSRKRAEEIVGWLATQGFDRSVMSAVGRGERELKEPTADGMSNAANRRVEVIVR